MTLPNFLLIGAAKSGTSALWRFLQQHPQIFLSQIKEPNFFALEDEEINFRGPGDNDTINQYSINNLDEYKSIFNGVKDEIAIGEASTLYLYNPKASLTIRKYIPEAKLIAILRNPIDRAFSSFLHLIRDDREPISDFFIAIEEEQQRITENWEHLWHYIQVGLYAAQLRQYYEIFPSSQILIVIYDDFISDPEGVYKKILRFLELEDTLVPDFSVKYNPSGIPSNKSFHHILTQSNALKSMLKPFIPVQMRGRLKALGMRINLHSKSFPLTQEIRRHLINFFHDDIKSLQLTIGKDLSQWLEV